MSNDLKILVGVPLVESIENFLSSFSTYDVEPFLSHDRLIEIIDQYDGFLAAPVQCDEEMFEVATKLKALSSPGVGYDNIDLDAATAHGVVAMNVPYTMSESVAELTLGLALSAARKITSSDKNVREGDWDFVEARGIELWGKTWGQIALGRIGSLIAKKVGDAFSMNVLTYDPYIPNTRAYKVEAKKVQLNTLLELSDIVSINAPLTDETRHLIGESELETMKEGSILLNLGRGPIVDEKALVAALKNDVIGAASLDVTEFPLKSNETELTTLDNVVLTPHVGANTHTSYRDTVLGAAQNIHSVLIREEPQNVLNPEAINKAKG